MISVEEAQARILAAFAALPCELVGLGEAYGRVLGEDVQARLTQPPKAVSAMDGYALRAADIASVPTRLRVIGEVPAGQAYDGVVDAGQAVRIFTGAPLPAGADTVVIQEETDGGEDEVEIRSSAELGSYVRPAGLDFRAGQTGLTAGRRLTARDIGLAAAMNLPWLKVRRRPRIALLATGDEIVMPGEPLAENQIVSSNTLALAAVVRACGGQPVNLGIAHDDRGSLEALAAGAAGADLLVTTGGASVGKHDLIRQVLGEAGLEIDFWRIAMRPGKPLMFGHLDRTPMLGLPGNPVSTLVCAAIYLRPVIERLLGLAPRPDAAESARLGAPLPANDRRQDYLRAKLTRDDEGRRVATAFSRQDSSMLATLAQADCLIVRPPHAPAAAAGETVNILSFHAPHPEI
jgi:molybdopterin molybdotransferase